MEEQIKTDNIKMQFSNCTVLDEINIRVSKGEIFGLLGPSGAGKTTLIKILTGQLEQTEGTAEILGHDSRNLTSAIYTGIGMVLDNSGLYERLSCNDNLEIFTDIYGIPKDNIKRVLEKVGLQDMGKQSVAKLSKGMKQRLVLARAIMHRPAILFLDEPTSGLDPATASYIHQLILEEKNRGASIFMTTHNMEEATKLCSRVALLNEGMVVESGNPKEICRRYNRQNKVRILLKSGEVLVLNNHASEADKIAGYFKENIVESIHSTEPNLETVFMELTGRKFLSYD